ncbi:hypothetical protein RFI_25902, partial [Reticulomyxa filosa]
MTLDLLFEEYRRLDELVFDIPSTEKQQKLEQLKQQIEHYIRALKTGYSQLIQRDLKNIQESFLHPHHAHHSRSQKHITIVEHKENANDMIFAPVDTTDTVALQQSDTILASYEKDSISRAKLLYWIGHYLKLNNKLAESEQFLMKAIKLDPMISEAWNALGIIYTINDEPLASKYCYESAIAHQTYGNSGDVMMSYLYLSKILRSPHLSKDSTQLLANAHLSLEYAKKAL